MRRLAQIFGVRVSTVSRNIGALEQQLNLQLFQRNHDGIRLTDAGRDWVQSVRGHYDGLEEALSSTARSNREKYEVRVGVSAPFGRVFLTNLIDRFENAWPDIDIVIQDGSCHTHAAAIRRGHLNVAFVCGGCDMRGHRCKTILQERVAALLPADHPLAGKKSLTWGDLAGERLLVPQGVDGPLLDPCLVQEIMTNDYAPVIEQCCACQATVIMKVQIGKGFTITGESFAKGINIEGTVWRPIIGPRHHWRRQGRLARFQSQTCRSAPARHCQEHGGGAGAEYRLAVNNTSMMEF